MICRNVRCEAPRQRGSDGGARVDSPDRAPSGALSTIRQHSSVALARDAGDGRIDFPISLGMKPVFGLIITVEQHGGS